MDAALWANLIAGIAFVVAVVSAGFAWKSAKEANLANRISIHEYQRTLYAAFADAFQQLREEGHHIELREFAKLDVHVKTSRLYVDEHISAKLQGFYDSCVEVYDRNCRLKAAYEECSAASKHLLQGGGTDVFARAVSSNADALAEQRQLEADDSVIAALALAGDLDKAFIEKIKLT